MGICGSKDDVKETNAPTAAVPVTEKVIEPPASPRPTDFTAEIGFVVKSRVEDDSKVFINVFHHSSVLYIATTLTDKYTTDKSGNSTLTYDVVINTAVFTICSADDESKEYVSEQIIDYMNKKLPVKISQEFKIPRMKRGYVGDDIPTMKIPDASIKERLITERPEEERAVAAMTEENVHVASAAAEKSELDSPATGKTLTHAGTLNSVVEAEKSSLTRNASSLNSHVLQAAVSDATARQEGLVAAPAPARPAPAPGNSSPSKPADAMSDVGTVGTKKGVEKAPLTFSGYALKKSGSSFVGLQTRFFHLSEHGVVSYYQTKEDYERRTKPKGTIKLDDIDLKAVDTPGFSLISAADPLIIAIPISENRSTRVYEIHCETTDQAVAWSESIARHIEMNDDNDDI